MRVITGLAKGRRLKEPENMEQRPTTDKVKEGMFNIIQFDLEGRRVLDLFAGTGQLGIDDDKPVTTWHRPDLAVASLGRQLG